MPKYKKGDMLVVQLLTSISLRRIIFVVRRGEIRLWPAINEIADPITFDGLSKTSSMKGPKRRVYE